MRDHNRVFDVVLAHLQLRFNTLRLKRLEVERLINQLLTTTAPWLSSLASTGMNKKSAKALLLKMRFTKYQEKFCEMLRRSNVESSSLNFFHDKIIQKHGKSNHGVVRTKDNVVPNLSPLDTLNDICTPCKPMISDTSDDDCIPEVRNNVGTSYESGKGNNSIGK